MLANSFFVTTILFLALLLFLLGECTFLIPYRVLRRFRKLRPQHLRPARRPSTTRPS